MANEDTTHEAREPAASAAVDDALGVEEIGTSACWRLVEAHSLGRLALQNVDGHPDVFPLNYLVYEGSVYMRSAPGAKLRSIVAHPDVALEVDGTEDGFHWSVVIRGVAQRLDTDALIEASGILDLVSSSPTAKHDYIRLVPATVTGRRFPARPPGAPPTDGHRATQESASASDRGAWRHSMPRRTVDKPQPIPHLQPWGND